MNRKGFTLIEVIGVLVIIGFILLVAIPHVSKVMVQNEESQYKKYMDIIDAGAKRYAEELKDELGGSNDIGCTEISLSKLISEDMVTSYNDKDVSCSGTIRLNNNKGNIEVTKSITCTNKKGESTYRMNNINYSSCIRFQP